MFLAGVKGQPVDIQKFYAGIGLSGYNAVASIGAFILLVGILIGVVNAITSYRNGTRAGHDPWGGSTLEWFALSPPPPHNFDVVPDVRSNEPLRDIREAIAERGEIWPRHAETAPRAVPVAVGRDGGGRAGRAGAARTPSRARRRPGGLDEPGAPSRPRRRRPSRPTPTPRTGRPYPERQAVRRPRGDPD